MSTRTECLLADYLYQWEATVVRQAAETARISVSPGGHSSSYWYQQRQPCGHRLPDRGVRSEVAEADQPREVGWTDAFSLAQCGKRRPAAGREGGVEAVRPDQQLDQPNVGLCGGKRVGPVDQHLDLPPRPTQPHRHGQDLGFVVGFIH